jgi:hypothetical protein
MADSKPRIRFEYLRNPAFRIVHSDGVFGGLTPTGDIVISFYSERYPIPKVSVHELTPEGHAGKEITSERVDEGKNVVRELETGVHLTLGMAKMVATFLLEKVAQAEKEKAREAQEAQKIEERVQ